MQRSKVGYANAGIGCQKFQKIANSAGRRVIHKDPQLNQALIILTQS